MKIWDLSNASAPVKLGTHAAEIRSVAVLPGGNQVAVGCIGNETSNAINIWEVGKDSAPVRSLAGHGDTVASIAPVPSTGRLLTGGFDKTVREVARSHKTRVVA